MISVGKNVPLFNVQVKLFFVQLKSDTNTHRNADCREFLNSYEKLRKVGGWWYELKLSFVTTLSISHVNFCTMSRHD